MKLNNNISILDSLRAFAALSVCLYHFICTTTGYIQTEWLLDVFSVGKYGVQSFFVISGFVIPWAMLSAKFEFANFFKFLFKRLIRLEPPYLFSIVLALVILFLREQLLGLENTHLDVSTKQVVLHFGYLIPFFENYKWLNQVYWTLAIEFQYYFFIALLFIPLVKADLMWRLIVYGFMLSVSFTADASFLPYWLPVFLIGIILFLFKSQKISSKEFYISLIVLIGFCFYKYPLASVLYMLLPVFAVLYFTDVKIPVLNFFGKMSYSIYLIHALIGASLINVLSNHFQSSLGKFLVIMSGIIVTLGSSYVMYLLVEKPSKKWSSRIKYHNL